MCLLPWLRYKSIVKYKTAFYSFYLPVAAAMYMVSQGQRHHLSCELWGGAPSMYDWTASSHSVPLTGPQMELEDEQREAYRGCIWWRSRGELKLEVRD